MTWMRVSAVLSALVLSAIGNLINRRLQVVGR